MIGSHHSPTVQVLFDGVLIVEPASTSHFEVSVRRLSNGSLRIRTRRAR